jgi:hypothetical protein
LARAYRDGVVNLSVGNLRPDEEVVVELQIVAGVDLRDDGLRFRFPFALAPGYHPRARNVESGAGEGEIELPEEEFGDVILPRWMREAKDLHRVAFDLRVCLPVPVKKIGSPSHSIEFSHEAEGEERVVLATEGDVPDRDLVLDVKTAEEISGVVGGVPGEGKPGGLAVVVPSGRFGEGPEGWAARGVRRGPVGVDGRSADAAGQKGCRGLSRRALARGRIRHRRIR